MLSSSAKTLSFRVSSVRTSTTINLSSVDSKLLKVNSFFSLGLMPIDDEIEKTYCAKIDILALCNCFLYFKEEFSCLHNFSDPNFFTKDLQTANDSYTIMVNKYLPSTYTKLDKYAKFIIKHGLQKNVVIIENTFKPDFKDLQNHYLLKSMSQENKDQIEKLIEDDPPFEELRAFKD